MKMLKQGGFLLLEAVLAVCILSIICAINIQRAHFVREQRHQEIIQQNYATITYALASFVNTNYRLPKPSSNLSEGTEDAEIISGYVPYNTLGITKSNTVDGKGQPIFYAPNPELTYSFHCINYEASRPSYNELLDDDQYFCKNIPSSKIMFSQYTTLPSETVIAFVISDKKPVIFNGTITFDITPNTYWITRDILLMQYLRTSPCKCHQDASNLNEDLF